jgi:hypothetical protein
LAAGRLDLVVQRTLAGAWIKLPKTCSSGAHDRRAAHAYYMEPAKKSTGEKMQDTRTAAATTQMERENQRMERSGVARRTWVMRIFRAGLGAL